MGGHGVDVKSCDPRRKWEVGNFGENVTVVWSHRCLGSRVHEGSLYTYLYTFFSVLLFVTIQLVVFFDWVLIGSWFGPFLCVVEM